MRCTGIEEESSDVLLKLKAGDCAKKKSKEVVATEMGTKQTVRQA